MCCTITTGGQSAGRAHSTSRSASVPPVEAPMQTTSGPGGTGRVKLGGGRISSAVSFCVAIRGFGWRIGELRNRERDIAAACRASHIRTVASDLAPASCSAGLRMTSTAPVSIASTLLREPSSVSVEQITTGKGCCCMMRRKKVIPSMPGISRSSRMTSGSSDRMIRAAA